MKIAVYLNLKHYNPHEGGGFFYVRTILNGLIDQQSAHGFVFIVRDDDQTKIDFFKSERFVAGHDVAIFPHRTIEDYKNNSLIYRATQRLISFFPSLRVVFKGLSDRLEEECEEVNKQDFERIFHHSEAELLYYPMVHNYPSTDLPYFVTLWDLIHFTAPPYPLAIGKSFTAANDIWSTVLAKAARVLVESESGKADLIKYYPVSEEKISVLPIFASDMVHVAASIDFSEAVMDILDKRYILYPAQYRPHKNHIALLKAVKHLKEKGVLNVTLVLTGVDCGTLDIVQSFVKRFQLEKDVLFLGFVTDSELKSLYENTICLVYPSALGPTNMPLIEALSLGCPVVCSSHSGHKEICKEAALYFSPHDHIEIADKIHQVCSMPEVRESLIQSGRTVYEKSVFKVEHAVKRLNAAFDQYSDISQNWIDRSK